jgi:hypothetical protein
MIGGWVKRKGKRQKNEYFREVTGIFFPADKDGWLK